MDSSTAAFQTIFNILAGFFTGYLDNTGSGNFMMCGMSNLATELFGENAYRNVSYRYYTRENPRSFCDLQPTEEALRKCKFNPNRKLTVIIHGYVHELKDTSPVYDVKNKVLQTGESDALIFKWDYYTDTLYNAAGFNAVFVAMRLAKWIEFLQDRGGFNPDNFHIIAHSLGAELTHFTVLSLCRTRLGHVTYLDAAALEYNLEPRIFQPSPDDAKFVEAMHTSATRFQAINGVGYLRPIAHIDYYPNGGNEQPRCKMGVRYLTETGTVDTVTNQNEYVYCNHDTSYNYLLASFDKSCKFDGRICDTYEEFLSGECNNKHACRMGYYSKDVRGVPLKSKCYLKTSAKAPYCLN